MNEEDKQKFEVDEFLEGNLRYTEAKGSNEHGTYRECALWVPDGEKPVSSLKWYDFEQRFGSVAVPVEGLGDVNTAQEHRRKGYISKLMQRALDGVSNRVDAAFLFGISGLYGKFGFASCLGGSWFTLWLKGIEQLPGTGDLSIEPLRKEDLPAINYMFNEEHRNRPWTRVRTEEVAVPLFHHQAWRPGPEAFILTDGSRVRGYTAISGYGYGWGREPFNVLEAGADSPETAGELIRYLQERALERGVDTITIHEPPDSTVGRTVRLLGGEYHRKFNTDGGGMGQILNRSNLVLALEDELVRRVEGASLPNGFVRSLASGGLIPDSKVLVRLLTGYWSWADALHAGEPEPTQYADLYRRLFPGGGTLLLPEPFAHRIDGY